MSTDVTGDPVEPLVNRTALSEFRAPRADLPTTHFMRGFGNKPALRLQQPKLTNGTSVLSLAEGAPAGPLPRPIVQRWCAVVLVAAILVCTVADWAPLSIVRGTKRPPARSADHTCSPVTSSTESAGFGFATVSDFARTGTNRNVALTALSSELVFPSTPSASAAFPDPGCTVPALDPLGRGNPSLHFSVRREKAHSLSGR
jgi:hypothetical protein